MIIIYGKDGCKKCEAAKDKLDRLGLEYTYKDLQTSLQPHPGWREDGTVELMQTYTILDTLPLIAINGAVMDYPMAMKVLKDRIGM